MGPTTCRNLEGGALDVSPDILSTIQPDKSDDKSDIILPKHQLEVFDDIVACDGLARNFRHEEIASWRRQLVQLTPGVEANIYDGSKGSFSGILQELPTPISSGQSGYVSFRLELIDVVTRQPVTCTVGPAQVTLCERDLAEAAQMKLGEIGWVAPKQTAA